MTNYKSQFLHLGAYGRSPSKGDPCMVLRQRHYPRGCADPGRRQSCSLRSPAETFCTAALRWKPAGWRSTAPTAPSITAAGRRRLRRDGKALLAGVVSYPVPRQVVESDPAEKDVYLRWRAMLLAWLIQQFGEHLMSVVEHGDEEFPHIHFYVVPTLLPDRHLNLHEIHPGQRMKRDAAEAGACQKFQDAAYRSGMARWQDDFWYAVSRHFGHDRYGPKRARVSRRERLMEKRMEEEKARQEAALAAGRDRLNDEMAEQRAEVDHERSEIAAARRSAWQTYADPYHELKQRHAQLIAEADQCARQSAKRIADLETTCTALKGRILAERAQGNADIAALRERIAELEQEVSLRFVA